MSTASAPTVRRDDRLGEEVHQATLPDGLPVYVLPKPSFRQKYAIVACRYGSNDAAFVPPGEDAPWRPASGIAHFLEHELFEDEAGTVFEDFGKIGASPNAFTASSMTAYHFTCVDRFPEALDLLLGFVGKPVFHDEAVDRERRVIAQEIKMYDDSPDWRAVTALRRAIFHAHPAREDIAGTVESIADIKAADLERCYRTFYRPDNMVLAVAGDLDPAEVIAQATAKRAALGIEALGAERGDGPQRVRIEEPESVAERSSRLELEVSVPRVFVGWKDRPTLGRGEPLLRRQMEVGLLLDLLFGAASDFYERHYEAGLIDGSFSSSFSGEEDHGFVVAGGETDRPDDLAEAVIACVADARKTGVSADDLARIRNKAVGRFVRAWNGIAGVADTLVATHFMGVDLFRYLELLETIDKPALERRLAHLFDDELRTVLTVTPKPA